MMKKRKQGVVIATCLALIAIIILSGCGQRGQDMKSQKDLMEGIAPGFVSTDAMLTENGNEAAIDFSVRLFQQSYEPLENTLLAPMSVFYALSMTANGAEGNTLTQMEDGTEQIAEMMHSEESKYLEDENTTGFMKSYLECDYAFVALLPNVGITMEEYVASLSGEKITELMNHMQNVPVKTGMPKFEAEFEDEMSRILKHMGIADAFDEEKADFSGIGRYPNNNLFIDEVLHKTYIIVSDKGTKAGAATVVNVGVASEEGEMPEPKTVYLNRPFVYMIIDCKTNVPLFIGTVVEVENE